MLKLSTLALVSVLAPLPDLSISWVDTAPDRFPDTFPEGVTRLPAAEPTRLVRHAPGTADHLILTFSHALDLDLCHALLGHGFGGLLAFEMARQRLPNAMCCSGDSFWSRKKITWCFRKAE